MTELTGSTEVGGIELSHSESTAGESTARESLNWEESSGWNGLKWIKSRLTESSEWKRFGEWCRPGSFGSARLAR